MLVLASSAPLMACLNKRETSQHSFENIFADVYALPCCIHCHALPAALVVALSPLVLLQLEMLPAQPAQPALLALMIPQTARTCCPPTTILASAPPSLTITWLPALRTSTVKAIPSTQPPQQCRAAPPALLAPALLPALMPLLTAPRSTQATTLTVTRPAAAASRLLAQPASIRCAMTPSPTPSALAASWLP
jgi:hypothetical protein